MMAYKYLSRIPVEDIPLLNLNPKKTLPTDFIVTHIIVPPTCIRPSVQVTPGNTNEDDLTVKIGEMIKINQLLSINISEGAEPHAYGFRSKSNSNMMQTD